VKSCSPPLPFSFFPPFPFFPFFPFFLSLLECVEGQRKDECNNVMQSDERSMMGRGVSIVSKIVPGVRCGNCACSTIFFFFFFSFLVFFLFLFFSLFFW